MSERETHNHAKTKKIGSKGYMMEVCQDYDESYDENNGSGDTEQ